MKISIIILALVLTIVQDSYSQPKPDGHYNIDTTITGFHFAADYLGTIMYTPHGSEDLANNGQPSGFAVTRIINATYEHVLSQIRIYMRMERQCFLSASNR